MELSLCLSDPNMVFYVLYVTGPAADVSAWNNSCGPHTPRLSGRSAARSHTVVGLYAAERCCHQNVNAAFREWRMMIQYGHSFRLRVCVGGRDLPVSLAAKGSLGLKGHFPLPDSTAWDSVNNGSCRREDRGDHTNTGWWINRRAKMKLPSLHFITEQKLFREADWF